MTQTSSARALLSYLAARALSGVPAELWDSNLWLYGEILPLLSAPITGYETDRILLYLAREGGEPAGVAVSIRGEAGLSVYLQAGSETVASELLTRCSEEGGALRSVSTLDGRLARMLAQTRLPGAALGATAKLWTRSPASPSARPSCEVRELSAPDGKLFDAIVFSDGTSGWPGFRTCVESGVRYFGAFVGGRLVSVAGLCRLTRVRSEIIAVSTYREEDRGKGYAIAACRRALAEGLAEGCACTWTARVDNTASIRTAEAIGMHTYLTQYELVAP